MGLKDDIERFNEIGEERREDLAEFIQYGDLGASRPGSVKIPIKIVDLPEFAYDRLDKGGVGQGQGGSPDTGEPVGQPEEQPGDGDDDGEDGEDGEPGEGHEEHDYYEMDPEEFAEELDEELGLDLEPKGKKVVEEKEGDFTNVARSGPNSTLDFERMFKQGLKRKLAMDFDEDFLREVLKIEQWGPGKTYEWARENNIPVSLAWLEDAYGDIPASDRGEWESLEELEGEKEHQHVYDRIQEDGLNEIPFRREDERYRHPEIIEEKEKNVVVVNIRDVSGSMREKKRELVERVFTPLDWYLTGKYDNAEFVYIAHDTDAWEVERSEFFGLKSGGGTQISTAYELAKEILDSEYPWSEWNRYVFAAGDSENAADDTKEQVIPLMKEIDANLHAYVETQPDEDAVGATHARVVDEEIGDRDNVAVACVRSVDDVMGAIKEVLETEQ